MDGSLHVFRTVVVNYQIICTVDFRKLTDWLFYVMWELWIDSVTEHAVDGIPDHFYTCPYDYKWNDNSQNTFKGYMVEYWNESCNQCCKWKYSVKECIASGCDKSLWVYVFSNVFNIFSKDELDYNGNGNDDEWNCCIACNVRIEYFWPGLCKCGYSSP